MRGKLVGKARAAVCGWFELADGRKINFLVKVADQRLQLKVICFGNGLSFANQD